MLLLLNFGSFGWGEWLVIATIALLVFGGKRLPELSRNLGRALRQFQHGWEEVKRELQKNDKSVK